MFLAHGCRQEVPPQPETFESIEVVLRPVGELAELVRREEICHTLVINALGFARLI